MAYWDAIYDYTDLAMITQILNQRNLLLISVIQKQKTKTKMLNLGYNKTHIFTYFNTLNDF